MSDSCSDSISATLWAQLGCGGASLITPGASNRNRLLLPQPPVPLMSGSYTEPQRYCIYCVTMVHLRHRSLQSPSCEHSLAMPPLPLWRHANAWVLARALIAFILLLVTGSSCVPSRGESGTASLALHERSVEFVAGSSASSVTLYLAGEGVRAVDERCSAANGQVRCDVGDVEPGAVVEVANRGASAAAASWFDEGGPFLRYSRIPSESSSLFFPPALAERTPSRDDVPWVGDPAFDPDTLSSSVREWYEILWDALRDAPPAERTRGEDQYHVARTLNLEVTALLLALAETGDLRILDQIDAAMQVAREGLRDAWLDGTRDGYRGWLFLRDDDHHQGRDTRILDDMMAHGMVAAVAYAYFVNRFQQSPGGVDYNARFEFWVDYLLHDFEGKWRERNDVSTGFPFAEKTLTHSEIGMLRYYVYMGAMGYQEHQREAVGGARAMLRHFQAVDSPGGEAFVFDHGFADREHGMTMTNYARYTMPIILEFAVLDISVFEEAVLAAFANTVAYHLLDQTPPFEPTDLMGPDVGGGESVAGIVQSRAALEGVRTGVNRFVFFAPFVRYDSSGRIMDAVDVAFDEVRGREMIILAANMVFAEGKSGPGGTSR